MIFDHLSSLISHGVAALIAAAVTAVVLLAVGRRRRTAAVRVRPSPWLDFKSQEQEQAAHEIHDGLVQNMVGVQMTLDAMLDRGLDNNSAATEQLEWCRGLVHQSINQARRVIRYLEPGLEPADLGAAITCLLDDDQFHSLQIDFQHQGPLADISPLHAETVFRIVQETLTQLHRDGNATDVSIDLRVESQCLKLNIHNNGYVPDSDRLERLQSLRRRIATMGGETRIEPFPAISKMELNLTIPLEH